MREDWIETEIINVLDTLPNGKKMNQGWSPQCKNYPSSSNEIWGVLKTTAIQPNQFWDHENKELPSEKEIKHHLEVAQGDILVTCAGPRNRCGVVCTVRDTRPRLLLSGKMYRFRPNKEVLDTDFLSFFLQTHESWLAIDAMKTGTSESGLNLTHARFKKLRTLIAPLPEQRAIVAKIEELFLELDKGEEDLKKAQEQLKIYRQAVLKKAFEGEWKKLSLGELGTWGSGGTPSRANPDYFKGSIPWVKTGELGPKYITTAEEKITEQAIKNSSAKLFPSNSVAIAMYGATIGKTSIFKAPLSTNQACAVVQPKDSVNVEFLYYLLTSMKRNFISLGKGGAQPNISQTLIKQQIVPLPDLESQKVIVQEIESRLSVCDSIEESIHESLDKSKALRQSILKKAFEGTLLSEEEIAACKAASDYEPASVLLERIKAEKKKN